MCPGFLNVQHTGLEAEFAFQHLEFPVRDVGRQICQHSSGADAVDVAALRQVEPI
jgi:hypothetical protein